MVGIFIVLIVLNYNFPTHETVIGQLRDKKDRIVVPTYADSQYALSPVVEKKITLLSIIFPLVYSINNSNTPKFYTGTPESRPVISLALNF